MNKYVGFFKMLEFTTEVKRQAFSRLKNTSAYIVNYVFEGEGKLYTKNDSRKLCAGDVFFCFPSVPYAIESVKNFKYSSISFLGTRADMLVDNLRINKDNCIFKSLDDVSLVWETLANGSKNATDLKIESVLLYTFSYIQSITSEKENESKSMNIPDLIKKVIDDNITNPDLTLDKISSEVSYDKKYISTIFKNTYQITISEYITNSRIKTACTLIKEGLKVVSEISTLCGYKDPLYFSKVFKLHLGVSPRAYIVENHMDLQ